MALTYSDIIIPIGTTFKNATIKSDGSATFNVPPINTYDIGSRSAKTGEYKILTVVDPFGFGKTMVIDGFTVKDGTKVDIELITNVTNSVATGAVYIPPPPAPADPENGGNSGNGDAKTSAGFFTTKNIIIGVVVLVVIFGVLKWAKVF